MQLLSLDLVDLPKLPPLALTIGNYDGVHLGHQAMLSALVRDAKQRQLASAVMVFEPQPREFFSPNDPPARLSSLDEKRDLIAQLGVDYLLVANFNDDFRALSAMAFSQILRQMNAQHLVLGDDFRFGQDRLGDAKFLANLGFSVDNLATIQMSGQRISSTQIRQLLADGHLHQAAKLLGRDYAITGEVMHGDKIGRTLNFPTANVALNRIKPALHGIFAADVQAYQNGTVVDWQHLAKMHHRGVQGLTQGSLFAAVSVGKRPSVNGADWRLEVHLPQFLGDLYGLTLQVKFLYFLHAEQKYDDMSALKAGISKDVEQLMVWRQLQTLSVF